MKAIAVDGKLLLANGKAVKSPVDGGGSLDLGITGAAAGQIAKIASVDENGVPTSWEAIDLPSDGGSGGGSGSSCECISATDDEIINALYETGFINPPTDSSGAILLAADNNILTL